ncbi:MAG: hypothetical protein HY719_15330 [Planctomycetes bacterium]|nr:hypothetical protein [Planctomycetota bacterium]
MKLLGFLVVTLVLLVAPIANDLKQAVLAPIWLLLVYAGMWSIIARIATDRNEAERRQFHAMVRGERGISADYLV